MRPTITLWPQADCDDSEPRLAALRGEIDRLDDALLQLVERRLGLSLEVAALKDRGDGRLKLRPRREAEIIGRLRARRGLATPDLIADVWRELLAHGLQAQTATELVLWANLDPPRLREQARRRFGWAAPILWTSTPEEALNRACRREAVAVIENSASNPWWLRLAKEPSLSLFGAIGLAGEGAGAFLVGRVAVEDVAVDQRYEVIDERDLSARLDRGERIDVIRSAGALRLCHLPAGAAR